jgi:putative NAD(P)-binding protein
MKSIAIVGAGLRGLASAAYLKSAGNRVRLFERAPVYGGVWNRVHERAHTNTPYWGYTFHHTNIWSSYRPTQPEILANLHRMVDAEGLAPFISLSTAVESVLKTEQGRWRINDETGDEFDGLLVCPGFLGRQRRPDPETVARFEGEVLLPYWFSPKQLTGRRVTVIGSGASAMDMFDLAHQSGCHSAAVVVHPGTSLREIDQRQRLITFIKSNPLLYRLTKKKGDSAGAGCPNLDAILATPGMVKIEGHISEIGASTVVLDGGESVETDVLIWCTGWESPIPSWAREHRGDPTLVLGACRSCLDTAGFGLGAATAHAKGLHAALEHGWTEQFRSGTSECDCEQENVTFSRHIVFSLMLYYLRQHGGWRVLGQGLGYGVRSNLGRWKHVDEPLWSKLTAFANAPLGF